MPVFNVIQRAYTQFAIDAPTAEEALRRWRRWAARHRNQRFGKHAICVQMPGTPTILDSALNQVKIQKRLETSDLSPQASGHEPVHSPLTTDH